MQPKADSQSNKPTNGQSDQRKPVEYAISILHNRPEYARVKFVSTYFTNEIKDKKTLAKVFSRAFKIAHPFWKIRKITVAPVEAECP
jgi:hypothetical protein